MATAFALVYRDTEIIDFAIALLGCFIAGVVAVPINNVDDYQKLSLLLTTTQAHLALTTDNNLKIFHRDISAQKLKWPPGVEWWKTNEFGSYHPKKKDEATPLQVPDLAYIEFSRAPTGDLRGVVLSHRTIMHQMACLSAIISTVPKGEDKDTFSSTLRASDGTFVAPRQGKGEIILSYLDPREGAGLILGCAARRLWWTHHSLAGEPNGRHSWHVCKSHHEVPSVDHGGGLSRPEAGCVQLPARPNGDAQFHEEDGAELRVCQAVPDRLLNGGLRVP